MRAMRIWTLLAHVHHRAVMANLLYTEHNAQRTAVAWHKNHLLTAGWPITVPLNWG